MADKEGGKTGRLTEGQRELVESCLALARKMSWRVVKRTPSLRGVPFEEVVDVAIDATVEAALAFDTARGVKFVTFAYSMIHWRLLRLVKAVARRPALEGLTRDMERLISDRRLKEDLLRAERNALALRVWRTVDGLPARYRDAINMRYDGTGSSYPPIAKKLGVSHQRARQIVSLGVQRVRDEMGETR